MSHVSSLDINIFICEIQIIIIKAILKLKCLVQHKVLTRGPGIEPGPLHWDCRVLATGPPGKSPAFQDSLAPSLGKEGSTLTGSNLQSGEREGGDD